jgi:hypothetical protein
MAEIMKSIANSTSTAKSSTSSTSMSKQPLKSRGAKSMAEATAGIVKKNNKASNQNPKARELRERSSNSNGRKNGSPKHTKPSNAGPSKGRGLQNRK